MDIVCPVENDQRKNRMTTASHTPGEPAGLEALVALAKREHAAGRLAAAAEAYRRIIALRPDIAEAYNNLGNVLKDQGKRDEAVANFRRAATLKPSLVAAHMNLGAAFREQGKFDQAAARFRQALALMPNFAEAHNNLGAVLRDQGHLDQAVEHYQQALAINPNLAETHNNLGNMFTQQGKFDQALASYKQALDIRPDFAGAHYNRCDLKTFRPGDPDIAALEAIAQAGRIPPSEMLFIHFALGKALEDAGDYPRAFEHLLTANAMKRSQVRYNEEGFERTCQSIATGFDANLIGRLAGAGDPSPTPIFILGMPRSGSTVVEQILASHPQVQAGGELKNLRRVVLAVADPTGRPLPLPQFIAGLDADGLHGLGQAYLASLPPLAEGKTRITDKMPDNFFYVGLIHLILPNARIIHTMRDPVDTCVSCFSRHFVSGQTFSYDLAELGRHYRGYHH